MNLLSRVLLFATSWTVAHQVSLSMGFSMARVLEWIAISFAKGILPTQGLNPGLPHCRQILYQLSYQGLLNKTERQGLDIYF